MQIVRVKNPIIDFFFNFFKNLQTGYRKNKPKKQLDLKIMGARNSLNIFQIIASLVVTSDFIIYFEYFLLKKLLVIKSLQWKGFRFIATN